MKRYKNKTKNIYNSCELDIKLLKANLNSKGDMWKDTKSFLKKSVHLDNWTPNPKFHRPEVTEIAVFPSNDQNPYVSTPPMSSASIVYRVLVFVTGTLEQSRGKCCEETATRFCI